MSGPMLKLLQQSIQDCDHWVVEFDYRDSKGHTTRRVVSPIRMLPGQRFLALCLCREAPRQFYLNRCSGAVLRPACEVMMPMPIGVG